MKNLTVSEIQITPLSSPKNGLVAFAKCEINSCFFLGNIAIYTAPTNLLGYRLVFPTKKLISGQQMPCFYPYTKEAAEAVTTAIVNKYLDLMDNFHQVK